MTRRIFLTSAGLIVAGVLGFLIGQKNSEREVDGPLIGISSLTNDSYTIAVRESGGIPIVLPNGDGSPEEIEKYVALLDGLLMPGGADIPPSEYGEEAHETVRLLADDRFLFEKALSKAWIEKTDKPMLGICLGSQWINVASGGNLVQDIPSELGGNHRDVMHSVVVEKNTKLSQILDGELEFEVNSIHHQAVKKPGRNLRIVACSPDGVVEAIETTDANRFLIGVQWHPEKLFAEDERSQKLLKAFVEAARR